MMELLKKSCYEEYPRMFFDPASKRVVVAFIHLSERYLGFDPISRIWLNVEKMQELRFDECFDIVNPDAKENHE